MPLSRYFGFPFGWVIARTGWDEDSVIAEMKINVYNFINHQHHDAGAFQIYYKGPLAIDSGAYTGSSGGYNSPHNKNYFKRTIAHNSLLVYDPDEVFETMAYGGFDKTPWGDNDGGQRLNGEQWGAPQTLEDLLGKDYKTGEILAHGFGPAEMVPEYTYLKGDMTDAYSDKVSSVRRSFCFLNLADATVPAALIVYDRVVSSNPEFKKFWLLHSIEKPEIDGNQITIMRTQNGDTGKLINHTLLPKAEDVVSTPIGGEGKEFWVFGTNYENDPSKERPDVANERGSWRVEVSPREPAAENCFLNVMQVMDNTNQDVLDVKAIENSHIVGVQIKDRIVTFSKASDVIDCPFALSVSGVGTFKIMLTDLHEGAWQIRKNGKVFKAAVPVKRSDMVLYFEGTAGEYTFSM